MSVSLQFVLKVLASMMETFVFIYLGLFVAPGPRPHVPRRWSLKMVWDTPPPPPNQALFIRN